MGKYYSRFTYWIKGKWDFSLSFRVCAAQETLTPGGSGGAPAALRVSVRVCVPEGVHEPYWSRILHKTSSRLQLFISFTVEQDKQ